MVVALQHRPHFTLNREILAEDAPDAPKGKTRAVHLPVMLARGTGSERKRNPKKETKPRPPEHRPNERELQDKFNAGRAVRQGQHHCMSRHPPELGKSARKIVKRQVL